MNMNDLTLEITEEMLINAAAADVFRSLLKRLAEDFRTPDGKSMSLVLEPWPGGRWFRDLGNKQGHLWGFVQVIKPPTLLEVTGPMMMSYPAANHVSVSSSRRSGGGTTLTLRHRAGPDRSRTSQGNDHRLGES